MSDGWVDTPGSPARKNTRRWCKGKVGTEHQLEIAADTRSRWDGSGCFWGSAYYTREGGRGLQFSWHCRHIERCTVCTKILRSWLKRDECPEIRPEPDQDVVVCRRCQLPLAEHDERGYGGPVGRWARHSFWYDERDMS